MDALDRHPRLGICLDTCHLYVSGVDVTDRATLDATLDEVERTIGLDRLRALHVNDAATPLGSNRDRHANVLEGELGEELGVFLAHPSLQGLPAVMETPGPDKHGPDAAELKKVRDLHRRWLARSRRARKRTSPHLTSGKAAARATDRRSKNACVVPTQASPSPAPGRAGRAPAAFRLHRAS